MMAAASSAVGQTPDHRGKMAALKAGGVGVVRKLNGLGRSARELLELIHRIDSRRAIAVARRSTLGYRLLLTVL
jgi:DNA invertase Pin-like site-specific DNA recombinase